MNKKLLIVFTGNEGSSYLTNQLCKFDLMYDLGYERFDKHIYTRQQITDEDEIKRCFTDDFKVCYNDDYKGKIPFCKCRLFKYYTNSNKYNKEHIFEVINESKITHIILIYRTEFDNIIRKFYFKNNPPTTISIDNDRSEQSLGQFNPNRNKLFKSVKGTFSINKNIFELSYKQKINELIEKKEHYKLIQQFTDCKIITIEYNNLVSLNDNDFVFKIENFIGNNLNYNTESELLSTDINDKEFVWIDLFDEESKQYLQKKETEYNDYIQDLFL